MDSREKSIAINAYKMGVEAERERAKKANGNYQRREDSAEGMALTWATENEFSSGWDKFNL